MPQAKLELDQFFIYRAISTILLFGLLAEWLTPWLQAGEWTELIQPKALLVLIGVILLVGIFRFPTLITVLIGFLASLLMLVWLFRDEDQGSLHWLLNFFPSLAHDGWQMMNYGVMFMSDEVRMVLLFAGWLLLASALQSLIWYHQLSFSLVAATITYLLVLHISVGIDVFGQLARVIGEGLLLMALTHMSRIQRKLDLHSFKLTIPKHQFVSILLLVTVVMASALMLSEKKERYLEPVLWATVFSDALVEEMTALSTQITGVPLKTKESSSYSVNSVGVSGYSQNDDVLGQTITPSSKIVFHGWSSLEGYWRADTKAEYTGSGWADQSQTLTLQHIAENSDDVLQNMPTRRQWTGARIKQEIQYVKPIQGMPLLQSGVQGAVMQLQATNPERDLQNYIVGEESNTLYAPTTDSIISGYTLYTEMPITDEMVLRDIEPLENEQAEKLWQGETLARYTQLPESLPDRVMALASEVSGGGITSRYDQVKAIEQYLKNNYTYSLNSSVPKTGEDFVDHFLFEQQEGYCIHFSTAMVVMLRSQDIPARWVKGYQMGDAIESRSNDAGIVETLYEVRQSDAHAWVEVYFPTIGWVPFDPTPASEESNENTSIFSSLQNGWKQMLGEANQFLGGVTTGQWLIGISSAAGLVSMMLILTVMRRYLRVVKMLNVYKRAYKRYEASSSLLQLATDGNTEERALPMRNASNLAEHHAAKQQEKRSQELLYYQLIGIAHIVMGRLEKKLGLVQHTNSKLTWRSRVAQLQVKLNDATYKDKLTLLLEWIENISYRAPNVQHYPPPKQLQAALQTLLKSSALNKTKVIAHEPIKSGRAAKH